MVEIAKVQYKSGSRKDSLETFNLITEIVAQNNTHYLHSTGVSQMAIAFATVEDFDKAISTASLIESWEISRKTPCKESALCEIAFQAELLMRPKLCRDIIAEALKSDKEYDEEQRISLGARRGIMENRQKSERLTGQIQPALVSVKRAIRIAQSYSEPSKSELLTKITKTQVKLMVQEEYGTTRRSSENGDLMEDAFFEHAIELAKAGDYKGAGAIVKKIYWKSYRVRGLRECAIVAAEAGDYEAVEDIVKNLNSKNDTVQGLIECAVACVDKNKDKIAQLMIERAIRLLEVNEDTEKVEQLMIQHIIRINIPVGESEVKPFITLARQLRCLGFKTVAKTLIEKATELIGTKKPLNYYQFHGIWRYLVSEQVHLEDFDEASKNVTRFKAWSEEAVNDRLHESIMEETALVELYITNLGGKFETARQINSPYVFSEIGVILARMNNLKRARNAFDMAKRAAYFRKEQDSNRRMYGISSNESYFPYSLPSALCDVAESQVIAGDLEEARRTFEESLNISLQEWERESEWKTIAKAQVQSGFYEDAITTAKKLGY